MTTEPLWSILSEATWAMSLALIAVMLLRVPLRTCFGARPAYAVWLVVPSALMALLIPGGLMPTPELAALGHATTRLMPAAPVFDARPALLAIWTAGLLTFFLAIGLGHRAGVAGLSLRRNERDGSWRTPKPNVSPMVLGFWRPMLVLPQDFEQRFDTEEQVLVLAHEQQHLRAQDLRINVFAVVLLGIAWFNPLVWWAWRQFRMDQELACDARVVERHPRQRRAYARAMLKVHLDPARRPLACAWSATHPLHRRIAMLARPSPSPAVLRAGRYLVAFIAMGSGTAIWAQKPAPRESLSDIVHATDASSQAIAVSVSALQPAIEVAVNQAMLAIQQPEVQAAIQAETAVAMKEAMAVLNSHEVQSAMQVEVAAAVEQAMVAVNGAEVQAEIQAEIANALRESLQGIEADPAIAPAAAAPTVAPAPAPAPAAEPAPQSQPAPQDDASLTLLQRLTPEFHLTLRQRYSADPGC